jgi:hypothetical protein
MNAVNTSIYSRLQGTTAITSLLAGTTAIYYQQAKDAQDYPYIVWSIQGGGDENQTKNRTKNIVYYVRVYSGVSAAQAGSIDAQVDTALHLNPLNVSGWTNIWLAREQDIELVETEASGRKIYTSGGLYRLILDD